MKKLINLIALVMLVSTNVLTPFSYAQQTQELNLPEILVETRDIDAEQSNEVINLGEGENQPLDDLAGEENGHEKENQDSSENLNEEKNSDDLEGGDSQTSDSLEESDNQQKGENQTQSESSEISKQTETQEDEEPEGSIMMNGEKDIKAQAEPKKVTITYNLSGGYWVEDGSTGAKEVQFTTDANNMVGTTNRKTPSKSGNVCDGMKCMFDGWYLGNGTRWIGSATSDMTVYAKWLPFEDLIVTTGGVTFTIMDRNIGATVADVTNTDSYGYHFQWGNNYGFKRCRNSQYEFPNREKGIWVKSIDRTGSISTYYKGIWISENPWNDGAIAKDNLWGGSETSNPDTDRQGPCPAGYHVPDTLEWKAVGSLLKAGDDGYTVRDTLNLPFAGYRDKGQFVYNMSTIGRYWSSTPSDISNAYYLYFKSPSVSVPNTWQAAYSRSNGFAIRCFQNTFPQTLTFVSNGGSTPSTPTQTVRRWETGIPLPSPTRENSIFSGWYTTSGFVEGTKVETNAIMSDGPVTVYAKWENCGEGYKVVNNTCIDENAGIFYENGYIKITDGKDTVYIRDRNVGATISEKQRKMIDEWDEELCNLYGCDTDDYNTALGQKTEELLGIRFDSYDEMMNYLNSMGNYYYRGNNNGVSYLDFVVDNGEITNRDSLDSKFREGGKLGEPNTGWEKDSQLENPCKVDEGEYLPMGKDWKDLMELWGAIYGYSLNDDSNMGTDGQTNEEYMYYSYYLNTNNNEFEQDMLIPLANVIENSQFGEHHPLRIGLDDEGNFGAYGPFGSESVEYSNNNLWIHNSYYPSDNEAMPVRCFVNVYKVKFETSGGNRIAEKEVIANKIVDSLPTPAKDGYTFGGWYLDRGLTQKFEESTPIIEDVTLYAKWEKIQSSGGSSGGGGGGGGSTKPDTSKEDNTQTETTEQTTQNEEQDTKDSSEQTSQSDNKQADSSTKASEGQSNSQGTSTYSTEFQQAYEFAHENGITTKSTIESAQMNGKLTRIAMAKMLSQYAINVFGKTPDTTQNIKFNDVSDKRDADYDNGVTLAYQLGIMGQNMTNNNFRPDDEVTRAEFATALSRLLYSTSDGEYKSTSKYYIHHMEKLKEEGIITKDDPKMKELRGYVMIMLMRSAK